MKRTLQAINKLKEKGAIGDYAIGGAVASFFYVEATLTEDLDVFIRIDSRKDEIVTLSQLFDSLAEEGYKEFKKEHNNKYMARSVFTCHDRIGNRGIEKSE